MIILLLMIIAVIVFIKLLKITKPVVKIKLINKIPKLKLKENKPNVSDNTRSKSKLIIPIIYTSTHYVQPSNFPKTKIISKLK